MDLITVMQRLYASKINSGLQWLYDGGVDVWLGDGWNGQKAQHNFDAGQIEAAAAWLDKVARETYPELVCAES
jgi:hypothetical protein